MNIQITLESGQKLNMDKVAYIGFEVSSDEYEQVTEAPAFIKNKIQGNVQE
jgi:hypothetical protein